MHFNYINFGGLSKSGTYISLFLGFLFCCFDFCLCRKHTFISNYFIKALIVTKEYGCVRDMERSLSGVATSSIVSTITTMLFGQK